MILKNHRDLTIAIFLSLIPFLVFLSIENLKQMIDNEIYFFFLINSLWTFFILILAQFLKKIFFLFQLSTKNIFKFSIFNYIILFHFSELKFFLVFVNVEYQTEIFIIIYIILACYVLFLLTKYKNFEIFFEKFIIIYIFLNIFFVIFNFIKDQSYSSQNFKSQSKLSKNKILKNKSSEIINKNVYYLIFDGMSSLDYVLKQGVIDNKNLYLNKYKSQNLTYVENSISNYNNTTLSVASIFNLSSKETMMPSYEKYNNNKNFYPNFLSKRKNNLSEILRINNYKFYWLNDKYYKCNTVFEYNVNCYKNDFFTYFVSLNKTYFHNHLFSIFLKKFINNKKNNSVIFEFVNNPKRIIENLKKDNDKNLFIFGHIILPHPPWIFDENCKTKINNDNSGMVDSNLESSDEYLSGYKNNYICSLKLIDDLISSIGALDPDSLIIVQGDHGINLNIQRKIGYFYNGLVKDEETMNENIELIKGRSMIFNLIKDNNKCKNKLNANTNSNTVVFVLNCLFNLDLEYEKKMHHISFSPLQQNYGTVIRAF